MDLTPLTIELLLEQGLLGILVAFLWLYIRAQFKEIKNQFSEAQSDRKSLYNKIEKIEEKVIKHEIEISNLNNKSNS